MTSVRSKALIFCLLMITCTTTEALLDDVWCFVKDYGGAVAVGVGTVVAAPVVLGAAGFTAGGIAAGSYAAGMMSSAAIANGGGVIAGSAVATLQSIGAAGLGVGAKAAIASTVGAVYHNTFGGNCNKDNCK